MCKAADKKKRITDIKIVSKNKQKDRGCDWVKKFKKLKIKIYRRPPRMRLNEWTIFNYTSVSSQFQTGRRKASTTTWAVRRSRWRRKVTAGKFLPKRSCRTKSATFNGASASKSQRAVNSS